MKTKFTTPAGQARRFMFRSMMLLGFFMLLQSSRSFAALYAKIHFTGYTTTNQITWNGSFYGETPIHVYLELYSDVDCTIPATSTVDQVFQIQWKLRSRDLYSTYGPYDEDATEVTINAGDSSAEIPFWLGYTYTDTEVTWGTYSDEQDTRWVEVTYTSGNPVDPYIMTENDPLSMHP